MAFLVVGVPAVFFDRFLERARADLIGNPVFAVPLRKNPGGTYAATVEDCERGIEAVAKALAKDPSQFKAGLGVVVLRRPWETPKFAGQFFPFAICEHVASPEPVEKGRLSAEIANATIKDVLHVCRSMLPALRATTNRFETTRGKTRALLPLKNFRSDWLEKAILALGPNLRRADDPKKVLRAFDNDLEKRHPIKRAHKERSYFEDDNGRWFKMPGRAWHGSPWLDDADSKGHSYCCFLGGKFRLGGVVDDGFHFDCTAAGAALVGKFPTCHLPAERYAGNPHLNIYVNDFVRGPKKKGN